MTHRHKTKFSHFREILDATNLTNTEKAKAWSLYKSDPEAALSFVQELEKKLSFTRKTSGLRANPVLFKIWGKQWIEAEALTRDCVQISLFDRF